MYSNKNRVVDLTVLIMVLLGFTAIGLIMYGGGLTQIKIIKALVLFAIALVIIGVLLYKWLWKNRNNL